jgi:hypothetical protein
MLSAKTHDMYGGNCCMTGPFSTEDGKVAPLHSQKVAYWEVTVYPSQKQDNEEQVRRPAPSFWLLHVKRLKARCVVCCSTCKSV